jgi:hypothetical protein
MIRTIKRAIQAIFKKKASAPRQPNRLVIVESPYFNEDPDIMLANIEYARACMTDCLIRHESPFLSHLLYTQIMDDTNTDLRQLGIDAGLDWGKVAQETIVYTDRGISNGMKYGIQRAQTDGRPVTYRSLYKGAAKPADATTRHLMKSKHSCNTRSKHCASLKQRRLKKRKTGCWKRFLVVGKTRPPSNQPGLQ